MDLNLEWVKDLEGMKNKIVLLKADFSNTSPMAIKQTLEAIKAQLDPSIKILALDHSVNFRELSEKDLNAWGFYTQEQYDKVAEKAWKYDELNK